MSKYFPKPKLFEIHVKVELDLYTYAAILDTSDFAKKFYLASLRSDVDELGIDQLGKVSNDLSSLKSKVDKLDADKLETTLADLSKLSDKLKNDAVKRKECCKQFKNVNTIDITGLIEKKKKKHNAKIKGKISFITNLATTANLNAKINGVKNLNAQYY